MVRYLKKNACDTLILNGDIIDGWQLKKGAKWKKKHTRFFRVVLKMIEKKKTEVIYIRGNHDDFMDSIVPFEFGDLKIVKDYILERKGKKYLVVHGDIFDAITSKLKWLAILGDIGYNLLLWINKIYNNRRIRKRLPYYSLSQIVKQKVKSAVSYISNYETELVKYAQKRGCEAVICGHIHHPAITQYEEIIYLNSGDWVESLTALVENHKGKWEIINYVDWKKKDDA